MKVCDILYEMANPKLWTEGEYHLLEDCRATRSNVSAENKSILMRHLKSKEMSTFDCFHLEFLSLCSTAYRRICTAVWFTYYNAYIHFPTAIIRLLCHRLRTSNTKSERRTCIMYIIDTVSAANSAFKAFSPCRSLSHSVTCSLVLCVFCHLRLLCFTSFGSSI